MKSFKGKPRTKAKLPKDEQIIGGDAGSDFQNTSRLAKFEELFKNVEEDRSGEA